MVSCIKDLEKLRREWKNIISPDLWEAMKNLEVKWEEELPTPEELEVLKALIKDDLIQENWKKYKKYYNGLYIKKDWDRIAEKILKKLSALSEGSSAEESSLEALRKD